MFSEFGKHHFICLLGPKESVAKVDSQQFSYSSGNHFTEAMFKWYLLVGPPRNSRESVVAGSGMCGPRDSMCGTLNGM